LTTKTLTGTYGAGYTINSPTTTLGITATGYVGGMGLGASTSGRFTIVNQGRVNSSGSYGGLNFSNSQIYLTNGGVNNTGALIEGSANRVDYGAVYNFGSIIGRSAVEAGLGSAGASVTNGAVDDTHALIQGGTGVSILKFADVSNFGEIIGTGSVASEGTISQITSGVYAGYGGSFTNGSSTDTTALTRGADGVYFGSYFFGGAAGGVNNFGTIESSPWITNGVGVAFTKGGGVINGSTADQIATIEGDAHGIKVQGAPGAISNFGTIEITPGVGNGVAIGIYSGGSITNGSGSDQAAVIQGGDGVIAAGGSATISNFAVIRGTGSYDSTGVNLGQGGAVTNGASSDTTAFIYGYASAIFIGGGAGTVVNDGVVVSVEGYAVALANGGRLTNGATSLTTAVIQGGGGLDVSGSAGTVNNFGTIEGEGQGDWGVQLQSAGSRLTNGGTANGTALIEGYNGVSVIAGATVTNFGVINGDTAVDLLGATSILLAEGGSTVQGAISSAGRLDVVGGVATVTGGLVNSGALVGAGTLALTGGTVQFNTGSALEVARIAVSGTGTAVDFNASLGDKEVWTQTAGSIAIAAGDKAAFSGTGDSFSGVAFSGAGTLELTGGTDALTGDALTAASVSFGAAKVTLSGVTTISARVSNTGTLTLASGTLTVSGEVSGAGVLSIKSGVADFTSTFSENVTFTSTTGVLELARSQSYTGTVTGFSKTGTNSLDLGDIVFGTKTKATYSGTTTSGILTVTDGTHTAKINLAGNYTASTFTVSSDGHGGTKVVDPAAGPSRASPLAFIAAAASFGAGAGLAAQATAPWAMPEPLLAVGGGRIT
jgi:fibronectin-binding autotransporter adhesin